MFGFIRFLFLQIFIFISCNNSFSQSIIRSTLSCMGSTYSEDGIFIRQTVGQPSSTLVFNNGSLTINQGFQQPIKTIYGTESNIPIDFELYPNPTKGKSLLRFNEKIPSYTITIYNMDGRILKIIPNQSLSAVWIDIEEFMPGNYIVVITDKIRVGSKSLILIK